MVVPLPNSVVRPIYEMPNQLKMNKILNFNHAKLKWLRVIIFWSISTFLIVGVDGCRYGVFEVGEDRVWWYQGKDAKLPSCTDLGGIQWALQALHRTLLWFAGSTRPSFPAGLWRVQGSHCRLGQKIGNNCLSRLWWLLRHRVNLQGMFSTKIPHLSFETRQKLWIQLH